MAVGSSQRNLFYNIHAIVEPTHDKRGTIVQTLGQVSKETELQVLLSTYAYDSRKEMRFFPVYSNPLLLDAPAEKRVRLEGNTFNIDPPGCKDVDDTFTLDYDANTSLWSIAINIADVAHHIPEGSVLDRVALERATSFYSPEGQVLYPMLPRDVSEDSASLLKGAPKKTVSLCFKYSTDTKELSDPEWHLTETQTKSSYTYDEAQDLLRMSPDLLALQDLCETLSGQKKPNTHLIVEQLMIYYNQAAAALLFKNKTGILRRHKKNDVTLISIPGVPEFLAFDAAEFCLPTDENTEHYSLKSNVYTYASSPLRRYVDLVNQRAIKSHLSGAGTILATQAFVNEMNRRQKQAKAFSRDLFFMTTLADQKGSKVEGIVMEQKEGGFKTEIWVPEWKRVIKAKSMNQTTFARGTKVSIEWYEERDKPQWKDRIVFQPVPV